MSEEVSILNEKPNVKIVGKVYVNLNQLLKDYKVRTGIRLTILDIANAIYGLEASHIGVDAAKSNRVKLSRRVGEDSKYELTITEVYNICQIADLSIADFFTKYTLAV